MSHQSRLANITFQHPLMLLVLFLFSSMPVFAAPLDDYYLTQFSVQSSSSETAKSTALLSVAEEPAQCGTPLKHGLSRDWDKLEMTTQKTLAKQLASPVLSGGESILLSASGRFRIHYTTTGTDAVPLADANTDGVSDWVQTVAQTFDDVAVAYLARGWRLAPTVAAAPYDIYLRNLAPQRIYGQTTSGQAIPSAGFSNAFTSFIEIDNDFTETVYTLAANGPYSAIQSLQITAAHEYHHAIQYGYNYFFDIWYAEATSTWQEDELYDGVNQLYNYIPGWFSNSRLALDTATSTTTGGGYGRWLFNHYLAEQHGTSVVRGAWERLAILNSPGGNADIPMTPVLENQLLSAPVNSSLGADLFGYAKRVYDRNWIGHTGEIPRIPPALPAGNYSAYPVDSDSSPTPSLTLARYSFAHYRFTPADSTASDLQISLSGTNGIAAAVFKKSGGTISQIAADNSGKDFTITNFGNLDPATEEVVLMLANASNLDNQSASFSATVIGQQPRSVTLSFAGSGGGNVNGSLNCSSGQYCTPILFAANGSVILMASPDSESLFDYWSGNCSGTGNCQLTMDANKYVTANFSYVKPARINRTPALPFDTLAAAYKNATTGDTIQTRLFDFTDPAGLVLERDIRVSIEGGYNAAFNSNPDMTTVQGPLVLKAGGVTVESLTIR